jgi:hypothetical protein
VGPRFGGEVAAEDANVAIWVADGPAGSATAPAASVSAGAKATVPYAAGQEYGFRFEFDGATGTTTYTLSPPAGPAVSVSRSSSEHVGGFFPFVRVELAGADGDLIGTRLRDVRINGLAQEIDTTAYAPSYYLFPIYPDCYNASGSAVVVTGTSGFTNDFGICSGGQPAISVELGSVSGQP